jgi:hypothetical protein
MFDLDSKIKVGRIIGNPPYNRYLMKLFWAKHPGWKLKIDQAIGWATCMPHCVMTWLCWHLLLEKGTLHFVLPTNWMTLPSYLTFREWLLSNFILRKIHLYDNAKKQVFDITMGDVVVLHLEKCSDKKVCNKLNQSVLWQYNKDTTFQVNVMKHKILPGYQKLIDYDIIDKVLSNKKGLLCERQKTKNYIQGAIVGNHKDLQHSKTWLKNKNHPAGTKFTMYFDDVKLMDDHFNWYQTIEYNFILSMIKSSVKSQPATLDYIGLQDLGKLKFTKEEKNRINRWRP